MKQTQLKIWVDNAWQNLFPVTHARLVKLDNTNDSLQTWAEDINHRLASAYSIAKGAQKAETFFSYAAMIHSLKLRPKNNYIPGQSIMIVTVDVPDLWIAEVYDEFHEYTYISDEAFIQDLQTNGIVQVGYFGVAQLETGLNLVDIGAWLGGTIYFFTSAFDKNLSSMAQGYWIAKHGNLPRVGDLFIDANGNVFKIDKVPEDGSKIELSFLFNYNKSNGTTVTVDGIAQETWDADTKVTKYNRSAAEQGLWFVYTQNHNGVDGVLQLTNVATQGKSTIPFRDSRGALPGIGTPDNNDDAANKGYVDTNFVAKPTDTSGYNRIIGVDTGNKPLTLSVQYPNYGFDEVGAPSRNGIPIYVAGQLGCATPTADYHTANKKYVDNNFAPKPPTGNSVPYCNSSLGMSYMQINENVDGSKAPQAYRLSKYSDDGTLAVGTPFRAYDAANKQYVDGLVTLSLDSIRNAGLWKPIHRRYGTILDTDGRTWNCDAVGYYNLRTAKRKVEYTLISTQEITANADTVAISVPLIGVNYTLGAKYRAATIAYSALPNIEQDEDMGNKNFNLSYFTLDGFTWDARTDIGDECTPLPFRGSGGFEVKVLTWTENPKASITFKTIIAKVTKYEK